MTEESVNEYIEDIEDIEVNESILNQIINIVNDISKELSRFHNNS